MVGPIPYGQFVGELVNVALLLSVALWFFAVRPWKIRRRRSRGELNDVEALAKVKKALLLGLLWLALAVGSLIMLFDQANFFGDSFVPPLSSSR